MTPSTPGSSGPFHPAPQFPDMKALRALWVRDIVSLMAVVILAAAALIAAGTLAGAFMFAQTIPIYVMLAVILPAWWVTHRGGWQWTRFILVLLCFGLGVFSSLNNGFSAFSVLFYAISVILTNALFGSRPGFGMVLVSTLAYGGLGYLSTGIFIDALAPIVTFGFGLLGLDLLFWYANLRFMEVLRAQIRDSQMLKAESLRRERAEQVQREQDVQLRRLADNHADLVASMDKFGIISYASPSYLPTLGYDPLSLLGTNAYNLVHPDDTVSAHMAALDSAAHGEPRKVQVRVRRKDGEYIWMEIYGTPLKNDHGEPGGFVLICRDVHKQKLAEIAIQESEKKFRTIIERLPLGVHMYSLEADGQLIFSGFNSAAEKILGISLTHKLGSPIETAFPGMADNGTSQHYQEIARSGGAWSADTYEYNSATIQGVYEVHAFQTEPGKMVAVFSDITQRIRADEALRASEQKFSTAFLTSPDSVNINRLSDGVYVDINQGFTRLTGYTREDAIGKSSLELNIWADAADRAQLVKGLHEEGVVENLEARFRRKNGEIAIGLMSARIILLEGEKCILSITHEITEWIQAQWELRETHAQLERAYDATLQGWAHALELRERETADHSRRVVEHTLRIAQALGIHGDALVQLRRGALLHDIGKLGVPDEILLKPGPLTTAEWQIMRKHPEFARDLLCGIEHLHASIAIPYCHHEHWNGAGYPQGLKGTDIPLPARIFAIVDVFDALAHDRPYRPAWPLEDVYQYLIEQKGQQFDPEIVDLFIYEGQEE